MPATTTAPAPATAPPKPVASAKPAAAPKTSSPSVPKVTPKPAAKAFERPTEKLDNSFDALDKMTAAAPAETPAKPEKAAAPPPKREAPTPPPEEKAKEAAPKEEPKPETKQARTFDPDEDLFEGEKGETTTEAKPSESTPRVATLRQMYDEEKKVSETLRKELEAVKSGRKSDDPQLESLRTELEGLRKEKESLLEEIKFNDFTKHPEFKEKYEKPYHRAWNLGRAWTSQLRIRDPQTGEERQGTAKDFDDLMALNHSDPDRAAEMVDMVFGSKATTVASYMARVNEALQEMNEAREEYRTKGTERDKQMQETAERVHGEITKSIQEQWQRYVGEPAQRFPQWFQPIDGDDKGNELLTRGLEQARWALSHLNAADPRLTPKERESIVRSHAALFNKAAAFNRLTYFLKQRDTRISELEKELAQYRESEPGKGEGVTEKGGPEKKGWEAQLESLARG